MLFSRKLQAQQTVFEKLKFYQLDNSSGFGL